MRSNPSQPQPHFDRNGQTQTRRMPPEPVFQTATPPPDHLGDFDRAEARKGSLWNWLKFPVYLAAGFVGAWLLYRAFGVYQIAFDQWGLPVIGAVCPTFDSTPLFGGALELGCRNLSATIVGLIALLVLLALTILQSIPTLLYFHISSIENMVAQLRHNRKHRSRLTAEAGDTAATQSLIDRHHKLQEGDLKMLLIFSIVAFGVEAFICWTARGSRAPLNAVLVDSLAFDALLVFVLVFRSIFVHKPPRQVKSFS